MYTILWLLTVITLQWINIDPEKNSFLVETSLATPIYVNLLEGNSY